MEKKTRKITMTVFCMAEDAEEVKDSLASESETGLGDDWFTTHDVLMTNIQVKVEEPTDEEEVEARAALEADDELLDSAYPEEVHQAVAEVLGYEVDDDRIDQAMTIYEQVDVGNMTTKLNLCESQFEANGGRGIELADVIDNLRIALAVRKAQKGSASNE